MLPLYKKLFLYPATQNLAIAELGGTKSEPKWHVLQHIV